MAISEKGGTSTDMKKTKFVYFDLGNVILGFSHEQACRQIGALIGSPWQSVWEVLFEADLNGRFDAGEIDSTCFHQEFSQKVGRNSDFRLFFNAYNDIFVLNNPVVSLIVGLTQLGIPLGVLSNTSPSHWEFVLRRYTIVREYFQHFVLSFEVGACKPSSAIYKIAIETAGHPADSIFFMDDRPDNVAGAVSCGIDAVTFSSVQQIRNYLLLQGIIV